MLVLGLKECLVECATSCVKSEVILVHRATVIDKTIVLPRFCCLKHGSDSDGTVVVQWSCLSKIYGGGPVACSCIQGNIHLHSFKAYYSKVILFRIARDFKVEYILWMDCLLHGNETKRKQTLLITYNF